MHIESGASSDLEERPLQESSGSPRKVAFLSPLHNPTNRYSRLQQEMLSALGYQVRPLSLRGLLLEGDIRYLFSKENVVAVHWLEARPFMAKKKPVAFSLVGLLAFLFGVFLLAVSRAKTVYVIHNHAVHDGDGWRRSASKFFIRLLRAVCDTSVVHDPRSAARYQAHYLPHPLYWKEEDVAPPALAPGTSQKEPIVFGIVGSLRPYKGIAELLEVWPAGMKLTILGKGDEAYVSRLEATIRRRQLGHDVSIENRFLSEEEFDEQLAALDVLINPHEPESMLVSGTFFHALGRVRAVIARSSSFMTWASEQFETVRCFERVEELPGMIRSLSLTLQGATEQAERERALAAFGWAACLKAYREVF